MNCPKCGGECHTITDIKTTGKDFYASKACCGMMCFNIFGVLCGACGKGKQTKSTNYWICGKCGNKFKV